MRHLLLSILMAGCGLFTTQVQAAEPFQSGKHYVELRTPVPVANTGKIEVAEVFWYGCPSCYNFEPTLNAWAAKLPEDVNLVRIPAQFNELWGAHARLYFALEVLKVDAKVHHAVFEAIHTSKDARVAGQRNGRKVSPPTPESLGSFLAEHGVDEKAFLKTYNSFAVNNRMKKAGKAVIDYQIAGVPALIVNGKYRIDVHEAGGPSQALAVVDYLVGEERAAK